MTSRPHPIMRALAHRRRELGLTQDELAERLYLSRRGVTVSHRETGYTTPDLYSLDAHARALGLRLALLPLESPVERKTA
ncbi:helix-turn-helix transcriptional regulator [Streptosporangium sp. NPDC051022]|uniref:helix-turn-helix domain-containing protein n=1 Tax=Streptosporangium sp. NPDC051022 TaxID=3155752 RepID=UPI00341EEB8D